MDLKPLANPYTTPDGRVTLWMLAFRSLKNASRVDDLEVIVPQRTWTHGQTGETTTEAPSDWVEAIQQAQRFEVEPETPWVVQYHWNGMHEGFALHEPAIIDVEVAPDAAMDQKALALYVAHRTGRTAADWLLFQELISGPVLALLAVAYEATRDRSMDLPAAPVGEAGPDPQPASGGRGGMTPTRASSRTSPKQEKPPKPARTNRS